MCQSPPLPLAGEGTQHPSFRVGLGTVAHLSSLGSVSTGISLRSRRALSSLLKIKAASLKAKPVSLSVGNWAWTEERRRDGMVLLHHGPVQATLWPRC